MPGVCELRVNGVRYRFKLSKTVFVNPKIAFFWLFHGIPHPPFCFKIYCLLDIISLSWRTPFIYKPLKSQPTKWSSTLKQFVGCCRGIVWVFDHFVGLTFKGLTLQVKSTKYDKVLQSLTTTKTAKILQAFLNLTYKLQTTSKIKVKTYYVFPLGC